MESLFVCLSVCLWYFSDTFCVACLWTLISQTPIVVFETLSLRYVRSHLAPCLPLWTAWGCVHMNTSTSLALYGFPCTSSGTHEFACILIGGRSKTYKYGLPVNFTRTSSFCAGRVFIQLVESKLLVNSINIMSKTVAHIWHQNWCHRKIVHY